MLLSEKIGRVIFRADTAVIVAGERVRSGKEMMGKTPVYLYVNLLDLLSFFFFCVWTDVDS